MEIINNIIGIAPNKQNSFCFKFVAVILKHLF